MFFLSAVFYSFESYVFLQQNFKVSWVFFSPFSLPTLF